MGETKIEMAERHVREGARRIVAQKVRIETLTSFRYARMLPMAHDLLSHLEDIQAMSEEHLARFRAEAADGLP